METKVPSHRENGILSILSKPWVYNLFDKIVGKKSAKPRLVENYIRPFPGCRILEIGCGTASILSNLPDSIGEYTGFDLNPSYIEAAKKNWKDRPNCNFICQKVKDTAELDPAYYDIVLGLAIVHHLDDKEASHLFKIAHHSLKPNGTLITYDNVYIDNQHWFAKWLISKDRGTAVRTAEGYTQLANQYFTDIKSYIIHDNLKVPYTNFVMRCTKK